MRLGVGGPNHQPRAIFVSTDIVGRILDSAGFHIVCPTIGELTANVVGRRSPSAHRLLAPSGPCGADRPGPPTTMSDSPRTWSGTLTSAWP